MPKETPELPVSKQEIQIQPPSFLDKLKIHKFKILGGVLGVSVLAGAVFGAYKIGQRQAQPPGMVVTPTPLPSEAPAKEGDETANWGTYIDRKYKFTFKYPSKLDHQDSKNELDKYNSTTGEENKIIKIFSIYSENSYKDPQGNLATFKPWNLTGYFDLRNSGKRMDQLIEELEKEGGLNVNIKVLKVDGLDSIRYTHCEQACGEIIAIPFNN